MNKEPMWNWLSVANQVVLKQRLHAGCSLLFTGQNGAQKQVQKITCSFELVNLFDFICIIRPRWKSDITPEPIDSIFQLQENFDSKFII